MNCGFNTFDSSCNCINDQNCFFSSFVIKPFLGHVISRDFSNKNKPGLRNRFYNLRPTKSRQGWCVFVKGYNKTDAPE